MGNGQWAMGNGQWAMGNGQRATGNRDVLAIFAVLEVLMHTWIAGWLAGSCVTMFSHCGCLMMISSKPFDRYYSILQRVCLTDFAMID
jgi:hypothetical protein